MTAPPSARQEQPAQDELAALEAAPRLELRFVILCCSQAGLRSGTAMRLTPSNIIEGHIVARTKRGQVTQTPISTALRAVLNLIPPSTPQDMPIVHALAGRHYEQTEVHIRKLWRRWKRQCGITRDLRLHDLRRGLARRLYAATQDIRSVQSLLSHTQLGSTLHYLDAANRRVTPTALEDAIRRSQAL